MSGSIMPDSVVPLTELEIVWIRKQIEREAHAEWARRLVKRWWLAVAYVFGIMYGLWEFLSRHVSLK